MGGLLLSMGIMVLGTILTRGQGTPRVLRIGEVLPGLFRGSKGALLDLGILLLFATPVAGVVVTLMEFLRKREKGFSLIALILLVLLAMGFGIALR